MNLGEGFLYHRLLVDVAVSLADTRHQCLYKRILCQSVHVLIVVRTAQHFTTQVHIDTLVQHLMGYGVHELLVSHVRVGNNVNGVRVAIDHIRAGIAVVQVLTAWGYPYHVPSDVIAESVTQGVRTTSDGLLFDSEVFFRVRHRIPLSLYTTLVTEKRFAALKFVPTNHAQKVQVVLPPIREIHHRCRCAVLLHSAGRIMDGLGSVRRYLVEEGQLELFCFGCRTLLRGGFFSGRAGLNAVGQRGLQIIKKLLRIRVRSSPVVPLIQIHNGQGVASTVAIITNIGRFVACECFDKVVHFHTRTVGLHVFHQAHYVLSGSTCNTILFEDGLGRAGVADGFWHSIGRGRLCLFRSLDFQQVLIYPSTRGFETALTCCIAQQLAGRIQQRFFSGRVQRTTLNQVLGAFQLTEQLDGRTDTLWNMNVATVQNIVGETETGSSTFGTLFRREQFVERNFSLFGLGVISQAFAHRTLFGCINFGCHLSVSTSGIGLGHTFLVCLQRQFTIYVVRQAWVYIAWDSQRRVRAWQGQWCGRLLRLRLGLCLL